MNVGKLIIGTTVVKKSAYAINKFLQNQVEIQNHNPETELIIATDEIKFLGQLNNHINRYKLRGGVIYYKTEKPNYAKDNRIWSMSAGREAIRQYVLGETDANWLFSVDADMTFNPKCLDILLEKKNGWGVIQSGYSLRNVNAIGFSLGCTLIDRMVLEQIQFRCLEFKNGEVIEEGNMFEYDLVKKGIKIVKGVFLEIRHYYNDNDFVLTLSDRLPLLKRISTLPLVRYCLIGASITFKHDISRAIFNIVYRHNSFDSTLKKIGEAEKV